MERKDIEEKYKWDFSILFKTEKDVLNAISQCEKGIEKLKSFENKLNTKAVVLDYFKQSEEVDKIVSKVCLYAYRLMDVDMANSSSQNLVGKVGNLLTSYSVDLSFVEPELSKLENKLIDEMIADPEFKDYDRILEKLKEDKKHTLDKAQEKLMAGISDFTDYSELFDKLCDVEMKFEPIKLKNGETKELTNASYGLFIKDEDHSIRRQAHVNLHNGYKDFNLTLSQNYINYLKKSDFTARTYNFKSKFESAMYHEEVNKSVYDSLINSVHNALPLYQNFIKLKAKILNLNTMGIEDVNADIKGSEKYCLDYEDAVKIVKKVVEPFGAEYNKIVDRNFSERWVDVFPSSGKVSGAYSSSCCAIPFMLLNYNKTFRDISTIAHELGHSIHSYFSETYQPYSKQGYKIFVAEVASTVNELLLNKYLLKTETDPMVKKSIINSMLVDFGSTVFRQTMFSEFEYWAHDKINKKEVITAEDLNNKYAQLQNLYFGNSLVLHDSAKYEWSRIPHFYRAFYVYKYATGYISAVKICEQIEKLGEEYVVNHYLKFLKGGCSQDPVSLLKLANVDITSEQTYTDAFKFYDELLQELKK